MLRVALMSNSLPNRMSYFPAALPIQISAAQWNLNSTHNCATKSKTVKVSSHHSISPSKCHIIQSVMLWISNNNMLSIAILSYLHKALPPFTEMIQYVPSHQRILGYGASCLVTTFAVSASACLINSFHF